MRHAGGGLTRITLGGGQTGANWSLWGEDDGRGIPKGKLALASTRFAQVGTGEGSGLGLAISHEIATAHGGVQTLERRHPGLRVTLRMPRNTAQP